ncbi:IS5 family transposase [Leptospira noguchii]|nr:IS5 family transposase [Leptospira noguchii]EMM98514.1 transposase PF05598 domain protein [Leptospira noguchii str. 2007001578]
MKPEGNSKQKNQGELFRNRLDQILDHRHPLYQIAKKIDWEKFEKEFGKYYTEKTGRPGLRIRLLVGLHYLKHAYNVSDEKVVEGYLENPYWQHYSENEHFEHDFPCDPTSLVKWRKRIGSEGVEKFLEETILLGQREGQIKEPEFRRVNVDTTVQEKAITFPTDAKLYHKMRQVLVKEASKENIQLRQSYKRKGKLAFIKQGRYFHAKQSKRAHKETKRLKTYLGCVKRDIERKVENPNIRLKSLLEISERILTQSKNSKNKIYSIHSPEVECISKGKSYKRYEFGCKVSLVTTSKSNWVVGVQALHDNPYDGHTLKDAINQMEKIVGLRPKEVYVDLGYKGKDHHPEDVQVHLSNKSRKKMTRWERMWMNRRSAIEPVISHLKYDHNMIRNFLKGKEGDRINAILSAAGFNFSKLIRAFFCYFENLISSSFLFSI